MKHAMKIISTFKIVLAITLIAFTVSCLQNKNHNQCPNQFEGTLIDMSSLDGCGWMIKLTDGSRLNPINLDDFSITLLNNNKVNLSFSENTDMMDTCMAGKIISIICISDID